MSSSQTPTPADLARAALRRLAELRLPPTPEHFTQHYYATVGAPPAPAAAVPAAPAEDQLALQQRLFELFDDSVEKASSATAKVAGDVAAYGEDVAASLDHFVADTPPSNIVELLQLIAGKASAMQQTLQASHGEPVDARRHLAEIKVELQENRKLVEQDPLTGIGNRRAMSAILGREVARSRRDSEPLSVAMIDIDLFKKINDVHGHAAGDAALIHLVQTAQSLLRGSDAFLRYGGEEFLLVLPQTAAAGTVDVCEWLQRLLVRQPFFFQGQPIPMTFSAGVSTLGDGDDEAALLRRADQALYKAKQSGRNRVQSSE